ncbi:MAG: hypothetical protein ABIQ73_22405 [Acidimicrobiales bacterium]
MAEPIDVLENARRDLGLSVAELWVRYFALGGMRTALEIEAYLYGALVASTHDRDVLAVALNERFAELGGDHPVPYTNDEQITPNDLTSEPTDDQPHSPEAPST